MKKTLAQIEKELKRKTALKEVKTGKKSTYGAWNKPKI